MCSVSERLLRSQFAHFKPAKIKLCMRAIQNYACILHDSCRAPVFTCENRWFADYAMLSCCLYYGTKVNLETLALATAYFLVSCNSCHTGSTIFFILKH